MGSLKGMIRLVQFLKFSVVGTFGFFVDVAVYYLLELYLVSYVSRLGSFFSAVVFTYIFNKTVTFRNNHERENFWREFWPYLLSTLLGGTVNLLIFFICNEYFLENKAYLSIAIGSIGGLFVNFSLSRIIFNKKGSE